MICKTLLALSVAFVYLDTVAGGFLPKSWDRRANIQRVCIQGKAFCSDDPTQNKGNVSIVDDDWWRKDDEMGDDLIGKDGSFFFCGKGSEITGSIDPHVRIITSCKDENPKDLCFRQVEYELLDAEFDNKHKRYVMKLGEFDLAKPVNEEKMLFGNVDRFCVDTRTLYEQIMAKWNVAKNASHAILDIADDVVDIADKGLDVAVKGGKTVARGGTLGAEIAAGAASDHLKRLGNFKAGDTAGGLASMMQNLAGGVAGKKAPQSG